MNSEAGAEDGVDNQVSGPDRRRRMPGDGQRADRDGGSVASDYPSTAQAAAFAGPRAARRGGKAHGDRGTDCRVRRVLSGVAETEGLATSDLPVVQSHRYLTYSPGLLIAAVIAAVLAVRLGRRRRQPAAVSPAPDPDSRISITVI